MTNFISMAPAPRLVRAALAHCEIPLDYNDDHTVSIPAGPGWDSNGNMTIPEGHVLIDILGALTTVAMVKHMEDTMVLPSNVAKLREVAQWLATRSHHGRIDQADIDECIDAIDGVADNLDPAKR